MLYHYTSFNKLISILKTQQFWLTKISDFDDVSEFSHTISLLCKELLLSSADHDNLLSEITKINNLIFVGCFCSDIDSQYLWNNYGEFNIEFSKQILMNMVHYQQRSMGWIAARSNFLPCEYCIESQKAMIEGAIKQWKKGNGYSIPINALSHLSTLFKKSKFCPEQETRLVLYLKGGSPIKKLKDGCKEKDYWELPIRTRNGFQPIKSITIGPTGRPEEVANKLRSCLKEHQLGDIAIKHSKISYKEFSESQSTGQTMRCQNCVRFLTAPNEL